VWHDGLIVPGTEWDDAIKRELKVADLVIFLVSSHLLSSDYVRRVEAGRVFNRRSRKEYDVLPVLLSNAVLRGTPFEPLQRVPPDRPVTHYGRREDAWKEVTLTVPDQVEAIRARRAPPTRGREQDSDAPPVALQTTEIADTNSTVTVDAEDDVDVPLATVLPFPHVQQTSGNDVSRRSPGRIDRECLRLLVAAADLSPGGGWASAALHLAPLQQALREARDDLDHYSRSQCARS
jgi:hypothetical protein